MIEALLLLESFEHVFGWQATFCLGTLSTPAHKIDLFSSYAPIMILYVEVAIRVMWSKLPAWAQARTRLVGDAPSVELVASPTRQPVWKIAFE